MNSPFHDHLLQALNQHGIQATDDRKHARPNNIALQCPFCGKNDHSKHLSIKTTPPNQGIFACWRDPAHKGFLPAILTKLKIPTQTKELLIARIQQNQQTKHPQQTYKKLDLGWNTELLGSTPEWKTRIKLARQYLKKRWHFLTTTQQNIAIAKYNLKLARKHPGRIIIPITKDNQIVNYQARATNNITKPRYLAANTDTEGGTQLANLIYNQDSLKGGPTLAITEGTMDAISIQELHPNTHATATFGTTTSQQQQIILQSIAYKYDLVYVVFDQNAEAQAIELAFKLNAQLLQPKNNDPEGEVFAELA